MIQTNILHRLSVCIYTVFSQETPGQDQLYVQLQDRPERICHAATGELSAETTVTPPNDISPRVSGAGRGRGL